MPSTSSSWTALVAGDEDLRQRLDTIRARFPMLAAATGGMFPRAAAFGGAAVTLSQASALLGVRAAEPYIAPFLGILDEAIAEVKFERARTVTMKGAIWFVHLARCCGQPVSQAAVDMVAAWIPQLAEHSDWLDVDQRHSLSYFAPAFGFKELTQRFIDGIDDPYPPALITDRAAAVWPAFLREFPWRVSAGAAEWPFLFAAASLALDVELPRVGAETHKQVMQEIAQGH